MRILKLSHSAKNGFLKVFSNGLFKYPCCCKISKILKGPLETLKNFRQKSITVSEKIDWRDRLVSSSSVCYVEKGNKTGKSALYLRLENRRVSKKTLTKSHDYSRLFFQEKRRQKREVRLSYKITAHE